MAVAEDLLEKGFLLAYFIFPSRQIAIRVLAGALNKLKAQHGRENRRAYWRDKYLKRGITRIAREEGDALQWLIMFESDRFERDQEESDGATQQGMAIRYIKSLVRLTTAMSSFYVNIGLNRLLHNYSTAEAQRVYEALTERYLGSDEYRRAKASLMDKLEQRFGRLLKTCKTQHGELRFESWDDQERWADLVYASLTRFTPWSTCRTCPASLSQELKDSTTPVAISKPSHEDPDQIEMARCHAYIEPFCHAQLAQALAMDPPGKKLALPRFFMQNANSDSRSDSQPPEKLSAAERKAIDELLAAEAARRRKAPAGVLKVLVDGVERARLDGTRNAHCSFEIVEGAELIEIRTVHEDKEVVLATNRVRYTSASGIASSGTTIFLRGGRRLELSIAPTLLPATDGPLHALVEIDLHTRPVAAWLGRANWLSAPKYAFGALALLAMGWFLGTWTSTRYRELAEKPPAVDSWASPTPIATATPFAPSKPELTAFYKLTPDDLIVRGSGGPDIPSVLLPSQPAMVRLDLPVAPEDQHKTFRVDLKPFLGNTEILRQNLLRAKATPVGEIVHLWVPTAILESNRDYSVDLRIWSAPGRLEEINTFTFHTISEQK
jgi:hypothetical protein